MLAIRMQRTGRSGHAMFRMIVQESHLHPKSGRVVARLGHYDPHNKALSLDKDKAQAYLKNGARPSDRAVLLLKKEGVKLPGWAEIPKKKTGSIRNPDKLRKNQPASAGSAPEEETAAEDNSPKAEADSSPETAAKEEAAETKEAKK